VHLVVVPLTVIHPTVLPYVLTLPVDVVLVEISLVGTVIPPDEYPLTSFLSALVVPLINCTVLPFLLSVSVLFIVFPITVVLCPII
jgi:hypothetical protein